MFTKGLEYVKRYVNTREDFFINTPACSEANNPLCVCGRPEGSPQVGRLPVGTAWEMGREDSPQSGINVCLALTLNMGW